MYNHVVEVGDTWWKIAKAYNVSLQDLIRINENKDLGRQDIGNGLRVGDSIRIPVKKEETNTTITIKSAENVTELVQEQDTEPQIQEQGTTQSLSPPVFSKTEVWGKLGSYSVKNGETWESIADQFFLTVEHLKAANPHLLTMQWLPAGQYINIPSIGIVLHEYTQKKQMAQQNSQHTPHTHQPYPLQPHYQSYPYQQIPPMYQPLPHVGNMNPQTFAWNNYSHKMYRCSCKYCQAALAPSRELDEMESESFSARESSSFWGSSSYFESSSMGWESSSSWLKERGEMN